MQRRHDFAGAGAGPRLPLWSLLLFSFLGYGALAFWFPLWPNAERVPPADLRAFAPAATGGLLYAFVVIALFALLLMAYQRLVAGEGDDFIGRARRPVTVIILIGFALGLPLLFAYPYNAIDVFTYYLQGRISAIHGANPYIVPPNAFPADLTIGLSDEWAGETAPYGPVWVFLATLATRVSGGDVLASLLLFKVVALGFFLLTTGLLGSLLSRYSTRPDRWALLILWAWNPALLLVFAANAHNDALMLAWLVAGYGLLRHGRPTLGFLFAVMAGLTKPIAVLALPFFALRIWQTQDLRGRLRFGLLGTVGALLLAFLAFLPWLEPVTPLATPLSLVARLGREATAVAGFSIPVALWFGGVGLSFEPSLLALGRVATALFLGLLGWLLWQLWCGRGLAWALARTFGGYLIQALSFRIWYASWLFPWLLLDAAAVEPEREPPLTGANTTADGWLRVGFWFLLTTQLSTVIYGHLRVHLLGGQHLLAHLIGVPFTFGLPFVLARWEWTATRQAKRDEQERTRSVVT